jgi:hypothetical protein
VSIWNFTSADARVKAPLSIRLNLIFWWIISKYIVFRQFHYRACINRYRYVWFV